MQIISARDKGELEIARIVYFEIEQDNFRALEPCGTVARYDLAHAPPTGRRRQNEM